eukprot:gene6124-6742_t
MLCLLFFVLSNILVYSYRLPITTTPILTTTRSTCGSGSTSMTDRSMAKRAASHHLPGLSSDFSLSSSVDDSLADYKARLLSIFDGDHLAGNIYACPESLEPLQLVTRYYGWVKESFFVDLKHGSRYRVTPFYADFVDKETITNQSSGRPSFPLAQRFFQIPLVSAVYELGYRQNFENFGFPGIQAEFEEALAFFDGEEESNATTTTSSTTSSTSSSSSSSIVLDLSCGSGFMTRKFCLSNRFQRVIAADLSPSMLLETRRRCRLERVQPLPEFVRCDSAQLPFLSGSIQAVHAGAAMHCWPAINQSLAEVYRVLQPGGKFYATTFIAGLNGMLKSGSRQGFTVFDSDDQIRQLVQAAGFEGLGGTCEVRREGKQCVIIKATKSYTSPATVAAPPAPPSPSPAGPSPTVRDDTLAAADSDSDNNPVVTP